MEGIGTLTLLLPVYLLVLLAPTLTTPRHTEYHHLPHHHNKPLQANDTSGHLGKSATLRCKFWTRAHKRGWVHLDWQRVQPNGTIQTVIRFPLRTKIPIWTKEVPSQFKVRTKPLITIQKSHIEFNLQIDNLTCGDQAIYRCSAFASGREYLQKIEFSMKAAPRTPQITVNEWTSRGPERHLHAECMADVGQPPVNLLWYVKQPGEMNFEIIDQQEHYSEESSGCTVIRRRPLTVPVARIRPGTRYRCGYYSFIQKRGMYDEMAPKAQHFRGLKVYEKVQEEMRCNNGGKCRYGRSRTNNLGNTLKASIFSCLVLTAMASYLHDFVT